MSDPRNIELLAPAANAGIAIEAILHGADAVYIGPPSHGARKSASNSIDDIHRVVDFAHPFGAKVYATVNTIVYDKELASVEKLIRDLYRIGTDAIIVQDMGLLRLDLPPIALHASTQCDTRTVEKARFLEDAGFSQIVLARELTLQEIKEICDNVSVPVETFIHGALCVSYSGRCHASQACVGRSANRGECAQICRWSYNLRDASGKELANNRHLLSLKDFNTESLLPELLESGVSSLKIEGRLKDMDYVKNVTAFYNNRLNEIIAQYPDKYRRSSYGRCEIDFVPQLNKSFNRGFTHYFLDNRRPTGISSPLSPKSQGEPIDDITKLNNGDGISYFTSTKEYEGVKVNGIKDGRIISNRSIKIPKGTKIFRTFDNEWQKRLARPTSTRRLRLDLTLNVNSITAKDEKGVEVTLPLNCNIQKSTSGISLRDYFDKLGNTIYYLGNFESNVEKPFLPASKIAELRRSLVETLKRTSQATYRYDLRRKETPGIKYPSSELDYQDNVANVKAREFYIDHGVETIEPALETGKGVEKRNGLLSVMTTRHCILREMGKCLKMTENKDLGCSLPLSLHSGKNKFLLEFDCKRCEMHLLIEK